MGDPQLGVFRLGVIGCAPFTHGRMWAQQWQREPEHGLRASRLWDADRSHAEALAAMTGATVATQPEAVADDCDGVVIATLDPAEYLALARPHLLAGRRVFLNRPFAGSVAEARELQQLAAHYGGAVYSASALLHTRASEQVRQALTSIGALRYFTLTGPTATAEWYLPHLFACLAGSLGGGLKQIISAELPVRDGDWQQLTAPAIVTVEFGPESAVGSVRGTLALVGPGSDWYGFTLQLFGSQSSAIIEFDVGYGLLFAALRDFWRDGRAPVSAGLQLEQVAAYYATLQAAQRGTSVALAALLEENQP